MKPCNEIDQTLNDMALKLTGARDKNEAIILSLQILIQLNKQMSKQLWKDYHQHHDD